MKKRIIPLALVFLLAVFAGCDTPEESKADASSKDSLLHTSETVSETVSEAFDFIIVDYRDSHEFLDTGISTFYQDETYAYFFPMSQMHEYVIVEYADGTTQNVKEALADGNITIADLDRFNIEYFKDPIEE